MQSANIEEQFFNQTSWTELYVMGAEIHPLEKGFIYTELRLDNSVGVNGIKGISGFTLGLRYDFGWEMKSAYNPGQ